MTLTLDEVKNMVTSFSTEKFGDRVFTVPLEKLKDEIDEAIKSGDLVEFADMQICLLDAFRIRFPALTTDVLLSACAKKLNVNNSRDWSKANEKGVHQHI